MNDESQVTKEPKYQPMQDRLIDFAVNACQIIDELPTGSATSHISRQLVRSCTSAPANYAEAQDAESRKDFIHRMKVCLKELRETLVWITLTFRLLPIELSQVKPIVQENNELIAIFVKSVLTAKRNGQQSKVS